MDYRLKALIEALAQEKEGNKETFRRVEQLAQEHGLPLIFSNGANYYSIDHFGPNVSIEGYDGKWDIDNEPISAEEFLAAMKEHLLGEITAAKKEGDELRAIIQGFLSKQVGFKELKEAVEEIA